MEKSLNPALLFFRTGSLISFRTQSEYEDLALIRTELLSLITGPSTVTFAEMGLRPPRILKFFLLPCLVVILNTEESLPPYSAGIWPLYMEKSLMISELNAGKNPNKWEVL